ncbi:MAG: DUF4288 domain-containing protein [Luteibacter sp.]
MTEDHGQRGERYAAKLMFQYRIAGDTPGGFRTVEERIILIYAADASAAYAAAQAKGKSAKFSYRNNLDTRVYFEFVGVIDLMHLGVETEEDEVWYDIRRMKDPMRRQRDLVPDKRDLDAFRLERAFADQGRAVSRRK